MRKGSREEKEEKVKRLKVKVGIKDEWRKEERAGKGGAQKGGEKGAENKGENEGGEGRKRRRSEGRGGDAVVLPSGDAGKTERRWWRGHCDITYQMEVSRQLLRGEERLLQGPVGPEDAEDHQQHHHEEEEQGAQEEAEDEPPRRRA